MVKRPSQIAPRAPLTRQQIQSAFYGGSPEHKSERWWGGLPKGYVDAKGIATRPGKATTTICPLVTTADSNKATAWVRYALSSGQYRFYEGDKDFPKRIWYKDETDGQIWCGFLVTSGLGEYKGWPIDEEERVEIFG